MNNKHMQYAACAVVGMVAGVILAIVLHLAVSYADATAYMHEIQGTYGHAVCTVELDGIQAGWQVYCR